MVASTSTNILQLNAVSKHFGALKALDNVTLAVKEGEILGIAGPNGSGKSTLFNVITKIPIHADHGQISFFGTDIGGHSSARICALGIARTFQRGYVFETLSVVDNVIVAVEQVDGGTSMRARITAAETALGRAGFPETMHNSLAGSLPVFYRKLLMIAGALALQPKLLLLDEPASSLTPGEIEQIRELIVALRAGGITIILIEHVLALLTGVSDRLIVLDQGQIISQGKPAKVVADDAVINAYLGGGSDV